MHLHATELCRDVRGHRQSPSAYPEHQKVNWESQKLKLDAEDIAKIDALDEGRRNANPSFAPKW